MKYEDLFDGTLGMCNTTPINFRVEGRCKASVLATLPSTKGTQSHVHKISQKTCKLGVS